MALSGILQARLALALRSVPAAQELKTELDSKAGTLVTGAAYTQTYATAARTVAAATAATLTGASGGSANTALETCSTAVTGVDGTGSNAASKADVDTRLTSIANNLADLMGQVNALVADNLNLRQLINALIDDVQANNIAG